MPTDVSKNFAIRVIYTATTDGQGLWGVPIVCPIDCTQVVIENTDTVNDQQVRTDRTDQTTQKTLPKTLELTLRAMSSGGPVFQRGETVCYIAPAAGIGPVVCSFLR